MTDSTQQALSAAMAMMLGKEQPFIIVVPEAIDGDENHRVYNVTTNILEREHVQAVLRTAADVLDSGAQGKYTERQGPQDPENN